MLHPKMSLNTFSDHRIKLKVNTNKVPRTGLNVWKLSNTLLPWIKQEFTQYFKLNENGKYQDL